MYRIERPPHILVVNTAPGLAELVHKALGEDVDIFNAADRDRALQAVRRARPDVIILGRMEEHDETVDFCQTLREGWISRHSSVLVVDTIASDDGTCPTSELLTLGIGEYNYLTGMSGSLLPDEFLLPRLREKITAILASRRNGLQDAIGPGKFCIIWEQIPGLGAFERRQEVVLENAAKAAAGDLVCAISVTDNPGGNPAIATEVLSAEIRRIGVEPLVHLALRDKNRNQCESTLYQLATMNINNVLVLSGDYPSNEGFTGQADPVFDLDSVNALKLIDEMNRGMEHEIMRRKTTLAPTSFFTGVAYSPFKRDEAEVMGQLYKLTKKLAAGADFVITQIGYDVRKLHELKLWLETSGRGTPVIVSDYVLPYGTARAMNANRVPGCVVTDKLLAQLEEESRQPDKGRQARLDRAAKLYAIVKGMGFAGVSLSGQQLPYEAVDYVVNKGDELTSRWRDYLPEFDYPQERGFYYFMPDKTAGLNAAVPAPRDGPPAHSPVYFLSKVVHRLVFEPKSPLFRPMAWLARRADRSRLLTRAFGKLEHLVKTALYECANCGDCALFDIAYLCPISQCPKNQRNAPCGGSFEGWCEVYPNERQCIWVRAYGRLKAGHREDEIGRTTVPPCNWDLWQTPSWLNYFNRRDHLSQRLLGKKDAPPE